MKKLFLICLIFVLCGCAQKVKQSSNQSYQQLLKDYKESLKDSFGPENPLTHYNAGCVYLKKIHKAQKKEKPIFLNHSIDEFKKAVEIDPSYAPAYYGLIVANLKANDIKSANDIAQKLVKIAPDIPQYHFILGYTYELDKQNNKSIEEYTKTLELKPDDEQSLILLANQYLNQDNKEKAIEIFTEISELNPKNELSQIALKQLTHKNKSQKQEKTSKKHK